MRRRIHTLEEGEMVGCHVTHMRRRIRACHMRRRIRACHMRRRIRACHMRRRIRASSIDMYNNDGGKRFMK
jgi:hypothetical protein